MSGIILGQTSVASPPSAPPSGYVPAIYVDTTGKLRTSMFWHSSTSYQIVSNRAYNDDNWHFVTDTYSNGVETLYVDGVQIGSQTNKSEYGFSSSGYNYFIGTGYTNVSWTNSGTSAGWVYFNGSIDDVRVYKQSLSLAQIQGIYLAGLERIRLAERP